MYTTTTATREQVLKAVAATQRAMKRHECSKSQFKFKCFSCGEMINRGDKITRCVKADAGMTLRYRGAGGECACDDRGRQEEEEGRGGVARGREVCKLLLLQCLYCDSL